MSAGTLKAGGHQTGFAATARTDRWWLGPAVTLGGLGVFIAYSTWAALQGEYYWAHSYLSPFYSPVLFVKTGVPGAAPMAHSWFGAWPAWLPSLIPASPAILILIFPLSFRFTCYYYRKAYYRAFAGTPPACAVGAIPQKTYRGETFVLIFQNLHRYALYAAICFIFILYYDAFLSLSHQGRLGIGIGSLVLFVNATLLACYTFGCHSWRHLVGGCVNEFSDCPLGRIRRQAYGRVSWLNAHHMKFAWLSLFWVGFTDLYVRLVAMGVIKDLNTWGV